MPYWECFYHCVWATKNRQPMLVEAVEPAIYGYLRGKAIGLEATVYALNGTVDHVHMVVSIPPKLAVATFIGQVKGVASTLFNKAPTAPITFAWQRDYGVFSFDRKRLPPVVAYVERQKEHHAAQTLIPILERMDDQPLDHVSEERPLYLTNADDWLWDGALPGAGP